MHVARTMLLQDVCLSVTRRYSVETVQRVIRLLSPSGRHTFLVLAAPNTMAIFRRGAHLLQSSDVGLLRHNMFLVYLLNNYDDDCILQTLFCSKSDAIKTVWTAFENYVL